MKKCRILSIALILGFLCFGPVSNAPAQNYSLGWTYFFDYKDYELSGVTIADLDGDGNKNVIALESYEGYLAVLEADGSEIWSGEVGPGSGWGTCGSPSAADLDGDGKKEIVVAGKKSGIYTYRADGNLMWHANNIYMSNCPDTNFAPVIYDMNGDGNLDIVTIDYNGYITLLNGQNGNVIWQTATADRFLGSSAVSDLDGDGTMEIIAFSYTQSIVYAINGSNGSIRWTKDLQSDYGQVRGRSTSPAIADFDGDGKKEVVVLGHGEPYGADGYIFLLENDGTLRWAYNAGTLYNENFIYQAPAIGDVDGDGLLDIVAVGMYHGTLFVLDADKNEKWIEFMDPYEGTSWLAPSLADIDEDGINEIITGGNRTVYVFHADENRKELIFEGGYGFYPQILIDDVDVDGLVELVIPSYYDGGVYMLEGWGTLANAWPTYMQNNRCTGEAEVLDSDGDGIPNVGDNCPTVFNPDQMQTGNNVGGSFGDACVDPGVELSDVDIGVNPIVDPDTSFEDGVVIGDNAQIGSKVQFKQNVTVGDKVNLGDETIIELNTMLGDDVVLGFKVKIEENVVIGDGVQIGDETVVKKDALIKANAKIGAFVTIEVGAEIGVGVIIGDGAKIEADVVVPDGAVVPAGATVSP